MNESGDHFFQTGNRGEEAKDTQDAERAQDGERSSSRNESYGDDEKVENVPAISPKAEPVGEELDEKLNAKDGEAKFIESDEKATEAGHDPGVGLQAEDDGVENNEKDDAELDGLRLDPCGEFEPER